jgi:diaminopropionate ammonia-lyase
LTGDVVAFHRGLPGYAPSPLLRAPGLASRIGVEELWVKHERDRYGLRSFKALGASWAAHRLLEHGGSTCTTLVAATEGNHGHAVAWTARRLGLDARIYLPTASERSVRDRIASEGATVVEVDGGYDDAVQRATSEVSSRDLLVSDVATDEDDPGPAFVIDGYATIWAELTEQLDLAARHQPTVVVPMGVGSLAASAVKHLGDRMGVIGAEYEGAPCVRRSLEVGEPVRLAVAPSSPLPGLNCGAPSLAAWPYLRRLADVVTVTEHAARSAAGLLEEVGIETTPTGAAALAGLARLGPRPSVAVVLVTEGAGRLRPPASPAHTPRRDRE